LGNIKFVPFLNQEFVFQLWCSESGKKTLNSVILTGHYIICTCILFNICSGNMILVLLMFKFYIGTCENFLYISRNHEDVLTSLWCVSRISLTFLLNWLSCVEPQSMSMSH
jgi:hypothetical protein